MSFFAGCDFFMVLFILLIPAVLLGLSEKKLKWYRWLLSLFFIWEVYGSTKIQLLYLIGYVIFAAYLVKIYLYLRKKYGRNKYIYGHAVFLSLLPLLVYKIGGLRGYSVFGFLGISYICFKIIQVVIECYDGVIKEIDEFQFIEFLIFFPCLSSGPIDRSRRFAEDDNKIWSRQEYIELLWTGLYKIILGIFYKVACSGFFYYLLQTYFAGRHRPIYSPKWPDGKKHARNVYARTREECEEKLKVLIVEMKAEIAEAQRLRDLGEGNGQPPEEKKGKWAKKGK